MAKETSKKTDLKKKTKVSKTDLINTVAQTMNLTQAEVANVINATLDEISKQLKKGNDVTIMDFGSFKVQKVKARKGRNIQTGETINIPAHKRVKFTAGKKLSESVSKKK